jgi:DNA-binding response OmpR family regulator
MPKKILIAEDDVFLNKILSHSIKDHGFDVETASDGVEALDKLKKDHFDLILLDLMMPKKDGFSVLTELRAAKNKIQAVVLSNLSQKSDIDEAMSLGVKKYFVKVDTSISEVVNFIAKTLTHQPASAA